MRETLSRMSVLKYAMIYVILIEFHKRAEKNCEKVTPIHSWGHTNEISQQIITLKRFVETFCSVFAWHSRKSLRHKCMSVRNEVEKLGKNCHDLVARKSGMQLNSNYHRMGWSNKIHINSNWMKLSFAFLLSIKEEK
jgi:hypothetical protein